MAQHDVGVRARSDPGLRVDHARIADHRPAAPAIGTQYQNAAGPHVAHGRVVDDERSTAALILDAEPVAGGSIALDDAILDGHEAPRPGARDLDADATGAKSLEIHVPDNHGLARVRRVKRVEVDR